MILQDENGALIEEKSTLKNAKKLLEDKFGRFECPMFYRSAIEILEMVYIPIPDVRESMTRVERWILWLQSESVEILRSTIRDNGNGLDENNSY